MRKDVIILSALSANRSPFIVYRIQRPLYIGKIVRASGLVKLMELVENQVKLVITIKYREFQWRLTEFYSLEYSGSWRQRNLDKITQFLMTGSVIETRIIKNH